MPFTEETKLAVKRKSHFQCCLCHALGIEVHHIIPLSDNGTDTEDNAAPLCPSCHETYGANSSKRKFIREARDFWYELCEKRYAPDSEHLNGLKRVEDGLAENKRDVRVIHSPLLPIRLVVTLKYQKSEKSIEGALSRHANYKKWGENDYTRQIGSVSLGPFRNPIEIRAEKTTCTVSRDEPDKPKSIMLEPVSVVVDFFFGSDINETTPSLSMQRSSSNELEFLGLEVFDETVFLNIGVGGFILKNVTDKKWSTSDLINSKLRVFLQFMFWHLPDKTPEVILPQMHNLKFAFGSNFNHILSFDLQQLSKQTVEKSKNPPMHGDVTFVDTAFECLIDKQVYKNRFFTGA